MIIGWVQLQRLSILKLVRWFRRMDVVLLHYYVSKNKIFELSFSYSARASSRKISSTTGYRFFLFFPNCFSIQYLFRRWTYVILFFEVHWENESCGCEWTFCNLVYYFGYSLLLKNISLPSDLDKFPTSISVILYFNYFVFTIFLFLMLFHFEVPDPHLNMIEFIHL